jgi:chromosome segregation ATPase
MAEQMDHLQNEANRLQNELETTRHELETTRHESEAARKKMQTKERQLKQRETAVNAKDAEQKERNEQNILLKTHVIKLEQTINNLEEQNKLLKLKLLTSEELRGDSTELTQTCASRHPYPIHPLHQR